MAIKNPRRLWATACLAVATSVAIPAMPAHAEPSPAQVAAAKKKLTKLSEQVEKFVEKYNQVGEELKAAKKKLDVSKATARREQVGFEDMRSKVAEMAATAYKNRESSGDVTSFVSAKDPQAILDQAAVFSHLSQNRASQITQFLQAAQRVQRQQAQAQDAYDKVAAKAKELRSQKAKVERAIAVQKKLIRQAGGDPSPRPGGGGGSYNGPASGGARKALQFAASQVGDPYVFGGTGPNGWDCSGLTQAAWRSGGKSLGRDTHAQWADTANRRIRSMSDLQPGDLVFFNGQSHMGIFAGGGKMYHAPRTGRNVTLESITSGYYASGFDGGGRP